MKTLHDFSIKSIEGKDIHFSEYKGKKVLLVNVASKCGFTPQYAQLQELYENAGDQLVVVGLPCNDFGGQEPDSENVIHDFCQVRYGVTFPLTEKVGILKNTHPIYKWLTQKSENGVKNSKVIWNFYKFLIDENGELINDYAPNITPLDDVFLKAGGIV